MGDGADQTRRPFRCRHDDPDASSPSIQIRTMTRGNVIVACHADHLLIYGRMQELKIGQYRLE